MRFECGNPILAINEPPFTSTRRIDANSPTVNKPQYLYHYRYQGLRLLITRSGTYYLLPLGWSQQNGNDITYILDDSDQIRIELY